MIVEMNEALLTQSAKIHSEAWKASHADFCSEQFVSEHTVERQEKYIRNEMASGKRFYVLIREVPVGIVSVYENLIENLYVLPEMQRTGCGTELLKFAIEQCSDAPCLWILENNHKAYALYSRHGFELTGRRHKLSDTISEVEMKLTAQLFPTEYPCR